MARQPRAEVEEDGTDASQARLGVETGTFAGNFTIYPDERTVELRVLVDRSLVEAFAQGGRACVTKRIYPAPDAVANGALQTSLLNLASAPVLVEKAEAFVMGSGKGPSAEALRREMRSSS